MLGPIILLIANSNYTQKYKCLCGKHFLLKGKKKKLRDKLRINFTIIKSITIFIVYVSQLIYIYIYIYFVFTHTIFVSHGKKINK